MARGEPHKGFLSSLIACVLWASGLSSFIILIGFYLLISLIIPPRKVQWILLYMSRVILLFCGQYMKVHGTVPAKGSGPYIYMFNHESLFDIFLIPSRPTSKGIVKTDCVTRPMSFCKFLPTNILKSWSLPPISRSDSKTTES